jgi:hypothetical protein
VFSMFAAHGDYIYIYIYIYIYSEYINKYKCVAG